MLFSIIMPVYNSRPFLDKSIGSVLRQSIGDWELITVNDGSRDGSEEILRKYADVDKRLRVFSQENKGVSRTRNFALDVAQGEYILFLDADDELTENALETIWQVIQTQKPDVVVYNAYRCDLRSNVTEKVCEPFSQELLRIDDEQGKITHLYSALSSDRIFGLICNFCVKAEIVKDIRFDPNMILCEDLLFDMQMYTKIKTAVCIPDCLYLYRTNPASSVKTFQYKKIEDLKKVFQAKQAMLEAYGIEENRNKNLQMFCTSIVDFYLSVISDWEQAERFREMVQNDGFIKEKFALLGELRLPKGYSPQYIFGNYFQRRWLRAKFLCRRKIGAIVRKYRR